ncbi:uncharacterized protein [Dermacentor albipictus]|uniref:uncharacterized protein n=1 Tax=Dermacentor albipictus TaxID=60249 RepID=UPI0038FCFFE7
MGQPVDWNPEETHEANGRARRVFHRRYIATFSKNVEEHGKMEIMDSVFLFMLFPSLALLGPCDNSGGDLDPNLGLNLDLDWDRGLLSPLLVGGLSFSAAAPPLA